MVKRLRKIIFLAYYHPLDDIINFLKDSNIKLVKIDENNIIIDYPETINMYEILKQFDPYYHDEDIIPKYIMKFADIYASDVVNDSIAYLLKEYPNLNIKSIDTHTFLIDNTRTLYGDINLNDQIRVLIDDVINPRMLSLNAHMPKYEIKLQHDFTKLYSSGLLSDVEILIDNQSYKVHKAILSGFSDYFLIYFTRHYPLETSIRIDNIDPNLFKNLLDIIYGLPVEIDGLRTLELIKLMEYFNIKGINIDEIVEGVHIDPSEFDQYINLLSEIYPDGFTDEVVSYIRWQVNMETDLSKLPPELQVLLRL